MSKQSVHLAFTVPMELDGTGNHVLQERTVFKKVWRESKIALPVMLESIVRVSTLQLQLMTAVLVITVCQGLLCLHLR